MKPPGSLSRRMPAKRLLRSIGNVVARGLARDCPKCGKTIIEHVFDSYSTTPSGDFNGHHGGRLNNLIGRTAIKFTSRILDVSDQMVNNLIKNEVYRRSLTALLKGIATFGLRKPQPTAIPIVIVWTFTNKCNLECIHCHQDSCLSQQDAKSSSLRELNTPQALKVVDKLADSGLPILTFSGGEALVRRDLFDVAKRATDGGITCTVASNGILMTKENVDKLVKAGMKRVEIGLDGVTAKAHDALRNQPGTFEKTVQGIKNCIDNGSFEEVGIATTLTKLNVHEIPQILDFVEKLGADRIYVNRLIPAGRGTNLMHLDVTSQEKLEVLEVLHDKFKSSIIEGKGLNCYARGMTYYSRVGYERSNGRIFTVSESFSGFDKTLEERFHGSDMQRVIRRLAAGFSGCSAGLTYGGLLPNGDLQPCVVAPQRIGNLLHDDLQECWVNNKLLNYTRMRDHLKGSCGICSYRELCGGCRFTGFATTGDWLGPDTSCPLGPS